MRTYNVGSNIRYNEPDDLGWKSDDFIAVGSCGYYQVQFGNYYSERPSGRRDYHIIYVVKNRATIYLDGREQSIEEGNMVLYRPGEKQKYAYFSQDKPEVYWIHFTGSGIETILNCLEFGTNNIFFTGRDDAVCNIFRKIISELQIRNEYYELFVNGYLLELLAQLSKLIKRNSVETKDSHYKELQTVIEHIRHNSFDEMDNNDYAKMCNMSASYFMHIFKEQIGMSPRAYKIEVRMQRAEHFLEYTKMSIERISEILGYKETAFFSKQFKAHRGVSPFAFRQNLNQKKA